MNRNRFVLAFTCAAGLVICAIPSATSTVAAQQTAPAPASGSTAHPEMPDGPGRTLVLRTCTKCHTVETVTNQHKDGDAWTDTITKMVGFGAVGTDDEFETILTYLTKNYSPTAPGTNVKIQINKETASQLASHLGLSDKDAAAIVSYREKNGSFKSIDDLKKVPSIDTKKIDDKKDDLSFS
jgi:competence protein ComEA